MVRIHERKRLSEREKSLPPYRKCRLHGSKAKPAIPQFSADPRNVQQKNLERHDRRSRGREVMLRNGWCCHQVDRFSRTYDLETFMYLADLQPSRHRQANHHLCSNHSSCIALNTGLSGYRTRHRTSDCSCEMVSTPHESLIEIIRRGQVPLLSIESDTMDGGLYKLRVHGRSRGSKYVAISHVWADGLGNPSHNALPTCQISWLAQSLGPLKDCFPLSYFKTNEPLFWMDTLCIPVGQQELGLRLAQIDAMASIYAGAISSFVLDAELMATELKCKEFLEYGRPNSNENSTHVKDIIVDTETRARIAGSAWMSRSWTFQEGHLPSTITMQFRNAILIFGQEIRVGELRQKAFVYEERARPRGLSLGETAQTFERTTQVRGESSSNGGSGNGHTGQTESDSLVSCTCIDIALQRSLSRTFFEESNDFVSVWNELGGRSTTKSDDIPLIITNILNLENQALLDCRETGQMYHAIISSLKHVPLSLMFNEGTRQDHTGNHCNRWVPDSIGTSLSPSSGLLSVHSSQLSYSYGGLDRDEDVSIYVFDVALPRNSRIRFRCSETNIIYEIKPSAWSHDALDTSAFGATCVLFENMILPNGNSEHRGACFYIRENQRPSHWRYFKKLLSSRRSRKAHLSDTFDLVYNRPLKVQQSRRTDPNERIYQCNMIRLPSKLNIIYDPIPGFSRLKKRTRTIKKSVFSVISALICVSLFFGAIWMAGDRVVWLFFPPLPHICVVIGWGMLATFTGFEEDVFRWWHVRSFEGIARRRLARELV